jgi:glycosyltransferase involved in cell wall biosynthesis
LSTDIVKVPKIEDPKGASEPHVAILLCTYNGERFIREQLDSIGSQTYGNWKIWVSDDGSTDVTLEIIAEYRQMWGDDRIETVRGPSKGFAANFLSVVCRPEITADYFAYCDQDDVWVADKLARAIECLRALGQGGPSLYSSRTRLIDENGQDLGLSPLFTQKPDFRNALVQNIGGGNTMVFSADGRALLLAAGPDLDVVAHDWWTYVAISAAGGRVVYDPEPSLMYRQHGSNLIGSNQGLSAKLLRIRMLMQGQLQQWTDAHVVGIKRIVAQLPITQRRIFQEFDVSRHGGLFRRLIGLKRSGVYRQTTGGNVALIVAAFFKKL